eukprot:7376473-Prymnesium_polylepis.1
MPPGRQHTSSSGHRLARREEAAHHLVHLRGVADLRARTHPRLASSGARAHTRRDGGRGKWPPHTLIGGRSGCGSEARPLVQRGGAASHVAALGREDARPRVDRRAPHALQVVAVRGDVRRLRRHRVSGRGARPQSGLHGPLCVSCATTRQPLCAEAANRARWRGGRDNLLATHAVRTGRGMCARARSWRTPPRGRPPRARCTLARSVVFAAVHWVRLPAEGRHLHALGPRLFDVARRLERLDVFLRQVGVASEHHEARHLRAHRTVAGMTTKSEYRWKPWRRRLSLIHISEPTRRS